MHYIGFKFYLFISTKASCPINITQLIRTLVFSKSLTTPLTTKPSRRHSKQNHEAETTKTPICRKVQSRRFRDMGDEYLKFLQPFTPPRHNPFNKGKQLSTRMVPRSLREKLEEFMMKIYPSTPRRFENLVSPFKAW